MHTIETATIAEEMDDNQALREILGEVRLLDDILREEYIGIEKIEHDITDVSPAQRAPNDRAVKTLVTNRFDNPANIFEDDVLVYKLKTAGTWASPLSGKGKITVTIDFGFPTSVTIATYVKG